MANEYNYSIIPNTGITKEDLGNKNYLDGPVLPQGKDGSLSVGGWTDANRGFWQQTFLGASIRNFNLNAGFGDTSSSLSVDLVNDEYNNSDGTFFGSGDDVYHNGGGDKFEPPVVGAPVFFKFGQNPATVEQAWRKTFDDTYGFYTFEDYNLPVISGLGIQDPNYPDGVRTKLNIPDKEFAFYSGAIAGDGEHTDVFVDRSKYYDMEHYDFKNRGENHFVFGGILQTYTENRGAGGAPLYNAKLNDPREILSNVTVLLNNYQGTTFNAKNLINVYGFLEYDPSDQLKAFLEGTFKQKQVLQKVVAADGSITYINNDTYNTNSLVYPDKFLPESLKGQKRYTGSFKPPLNKSLFLNDDVDFTLSDYSKELTEIGWMSSSFPITGQGFSRRSSNGIPWYRVSQALAALFDYYGYLPREYRQAGFGGIINFRGYNYVVDFNGLPLSLLPNMYFMDFDQLDLLSLAQEICDITSHELFVSLHPVIDHPACARYYWRNRWNAEQRGLEQNQIAGIIRLDAINKTRQPRYGAIKDYLAALENNKVYVGNRDLGYEVSNVTTDKMVVGAQEIEMYFFSNNKDRDELQLRRKKDGYNSHFSLLQQNQWELQTSLSQQIIPFYGFLGEKAVTIPKGFGPYKQIMLDAKGLDAHGVGNYYVATEMELRHAAVSYEQWRDFLLQYDETYLQEMSDNQTFWNELTNNVLEDKVRPLKDLVKTQELKDEMDRVAGKSYAVSVPRSVWDSEKNYMGSDGLPASPCNPPYGYPLYYKRAEKIGIPEAGIAEIQGAINSVISNIERAEELADDREKYFFDNRDEAISKIQKIRDRLHKLHKYNEGGEKPHYDEYISSVNAQLNKLEDIWQSESENLRGYTGNALAILKNTRNGVPLTKSVPEEAKRHIKNAKKVYEWVKSIADECLGKKFLVKIPKACNVNYSDRIQYYPDFTQNIATGPFGFRPIPVDTDPTYVNSPYFDLQLSYLKGAFPISPFLAFEHYNDYVKLKEEYPAIDPKTLSVYQSKKAYTNGALKCNWNPVSEEWDYNYKPEPQGGFFNFALFDRNMSFSESMFVEDKKGELPSAVEQGLVPVDLTNLLVSSNRISSYVRFDNSQYYDFSQIPSDSFTQQTRDRYGNRLFVPDVTETLDNVSPDPKDFLNNSMNDISSQDAMNKRLARKPQSVAYVKCTVSEELYMTPPISSTSTSVWASDYDVTFGIQAPSIVQFVDESGCLSTKEIGSKVKPIFRVPNGGSPGKIRGGLLTFGRYYDRYLDSNIIITEKQLLDPDNVYALITLPGKIIPIAEKRYCDSVLQSYEAVKLKNILTQDVVRHPDFSSPAPKINNNKSAVCKFAPEVQEINYENVTSAKKEQEKILRGLALASNKINFTSPSPVYPDIVALPLMSNERCYGPWQSANSLNVEADPRERYSDIGGKIEFIKDENLAPWNFAGYQLLNEAGALKAQLSNSLLLFSERGGFVYADYPSGISLAKHLLNEGPLVTSISVDIGNNGMQTTVKMDLYTSKFGKMQKQKEMAISQVARERQKIIDQNNAAIRRGLGKGQANMNLYGDALKNGGQKLLRLAKSNPDEYTSFQKGKFSNKISIMSNNIDSETGEFVKNYMRLDREAFDELKQVFPNNNDVRRLDNHNYIMENPEEVFEYMINGPTEDTSERTAEAAQYATQQVQQITSAAQAYIGPMLSIFRNND
jgi:hypothetical protein